MFVSESSEVTLDQLRASVADTAQTVSCTADRIIVDLTATRTIQLQSTGCELPASRSSLTALCTFLKIPEVFFLERLESDVQERVANSLLQRNAEPVAVRVTDDALVEILKPTALARRVPPERLVDVAADVMGDDATVVEWALKPGAFAFDVVVPAASEVGIGGDLHVGDITRGGLRFSQDLERNLAPSIAGYLYRLACTNGLEVADASIAVDARGRTPDEVVSDLTAAARQTYARLDAAIERFYELRHQVLEHPERVLLRIGREQGLPDRTVRRLLGNIPSILDQAGRTTLFELINLITNEANRPSLRGRTAVRRRLQAAGGAVVAEHAERCISCQARLN